ncbi:MAG: hypothetical protein GXP53_08880 [Deltaproteobacteria bacterium]|nr:hypothetical protein [Deltaproteobacteria bacterium]
MNPKKKKSVQALSQTDGLYHSENPVPGLCGKIDAFFKTGFEISGDVSHQLCSMFGPEVEKNPESLFCGPYSSDLEILLDLICFPDFDFQVSIEPLLVSSTVTPIQAVKLADMISEKNPVVSLFFPNPDLLEYRDEKREKAVSTPPDSLQGNSFCVPVPFGVIGRFVQRLNLLRTIDPCVEQAIMARCKSQARKSGHSSMVRVEEGAMGNDSAKACRVILRNGRFSFTPQAISFLCSVFEKLAGDGRELTDALLFAVDFLDQVSGSGNLREDFIRHLLHLRKKIDAAARADELVKKGPVEALMLGRTPIPSFDVIEIKQRIAVMERIGRAVYALRVKSTFDSL